ncbi:MAG: RtcB family protein [Candidatus Pacebacteria bacterium]|nr:RtcB family protein [Candidatus Paceibacterota bacterium]
MIFKKDIRKINDLIWEIPQGFESSMKVPARIYASEKVLEGMLKDKTLKQLVDAACLPSIERYSLVMPDGHEGYGVPIGFVGAMRSSDGVIFPGAIGYDINCGMRLLKSDYVQKDIENRLRDIADEIYKEIPSGLGKGRQIDMRPEEIDRVLEKGAYGLVEQGYGEKEDLENCESGGRLDTADALSVSQYAKKRGRNQVGTLGSGNHFIEIQSVKEIFNKEKAEAFGLFSNQIVIMIHTGSRGLGHQIATDYIKIMADAMGKYGISPSGRELAGCPINSDEGKRYFSAMSSGANYAWANRQMITCFVRKVWKKVLGENACSLKMLYDVAHNIAKIEKHSISGKETEFYVHRKGATRAFPMGHIELPLKYRDFGQPVLIPGSMGTASYVLSGVKTGGQSFYSTAHGAGRAMSRHQASKTISGEEVVRNLKSKGIIVKCFSLKGVSEEAPLAYKDIDEVIEVVHSAGLSEKVAKLVPLAVIKGE